MRRDRIGKSLELERLGPHAGNSAATCWYYVAVNHHLNRPSLRFEAGRQIHYVADRTCSHAHRQPSRPTRAQRSNAD
jgi:hypothetical protein